MPDDMDIPLKNIQAMLPLLLKKYALLQKENVRLQKENQIRQENEDQLLATSNLLRQQVNILKSSAGKLEGEEKKSFEKVIDQYIRSIDKCISVVNL